MNDSIKSRISSLASTYRSLAEKNPGAVREITLAAVPEQVFNSNAIENSTLTLQDTEDILIRGQIKRDAKIREIYEAKNLATAITMLIDFPGQHLTTELILSLHRTLLTGINDRIAGRFRAGDEWVRVGSHIGANPAFVDKLIYELVENYHTSERELLSKIAYFHGEFEYTHPFCDGNGRIGRVLINQQLMQADLPPVIIPARNKHHDYYPALDAYDLKSTTAELESYLALLLLESLNKYITIMKGKKLLPLSVWASEHQVPLTTMLNKAKRQTIPAFRIKGQWSIAADFVDTDGVEIA